MQTYIQTNERLIITRTHPIDEHNSLAICYRCRHYQLRYYYRHYCYHHTDDTAD